MIKMFKEAFYSDKKGTSAILSVVLTLVLGFPYSLFGGGTLLSFVLIVLIPMLIFSVFREKEQGVKQLRDYDFLNILTTSWVPILVTIVAIFS